MPDTDAMFPEENECEATGTIMVGRFTEADVTCGKDKHSVEEAHVTRQQTETKDGKPAHIIYVWH